MASTCATNRSDGRTLNELRAMIIESGYADTVDGSCKFSIGSTCVDVSVIGPVASVQHSVQSKIEKAHLDITVQSSQGTVTSHELYIQSQIAVLFESVVLLHKYPLTTIYIQVQIICDDGCLVMSIFNAACIALLDSGIDLQTFPVSVSLGVMRNDDGDKLMLFDPTEKEADGIECFATLSFSTSLSKVSMDTRELEHRNLLETKNIAFHRDPNGARKKKKRKKRKRTTTTSKNESANDNNDDDDEEGNEDEGIEHAAIAVDDDADGDDGYVNDMDLIYCDFKGKMSVAVLQQALEQCKVACYAIQFYIQRHFVETFKALPTIYVRQQETDNENE